VHLDVPANATSFSMQVPAGTTPTIYIGSQPSGQYCQSNNAAGGVVSASAPTVTVVCIVTGWSQVNYNLQRPGDLYSMAKYGNASWTDSAGNLWVFGGCEEAECSISGDDLWSYSPTTSTWTYVSGTNTELSTGFGVYGSKGTAAAANIPGARSGASYWTDQSNRFWLLGGSGFDATGNNGTLNDLWMYAPTTGLWTWASGSNSVNAPGVYGTQATPAAANVPGARSAGATWVDASGNLWLFGGSGIDAAGNNGSLNDLWTYSPGSGQWTWVGGANTVNAQGVYGTKGTPAAANVPGARSGATSWIDGSGNLWLFGGDGFASTATVGTLNDLWMYRPSTGQWTWIGGSNTVNAPGVDGILEAPAAANVPGARSGAASWTDGSGNFWLLGGGGPINGGGVPQRLGDLWNYSPSTGLWTWMGWVESDGFGGIGANAWTNSSGHVWVFGGLSYGDTTAYPSNQLWEYSPP
jgi:N-acetylneuraminic acid mutarotase